MIKFLITLSLIFLKRSYILAIVFNKTDSPYLFNTTLLINSDEVLIIEPGVTVNFKQANFIVRGELIANGTRDEPIYIELENGIAELNSLNGIYLNNVYLNGSNFLNIYSKMPKIRNSNFKNFKQILIKNVTNEVVLDSNEIECTLNIDTIFSQEIFIQNSTLTELNVYNPINFNITNSNVLKKIVFSINSNQNTLNKSINIKLDSNYLNLTRKVNVYNEKLFVVQVTNSLQQNMTIEILNNVINNQFFMDLSMNYYEYAYSYNLKNYFENLVKVKIENNVFSNLKDTDLIDSSKFEHENIEWSISNNIINGSNFVLDRSAINIFGSKVSISNNTIRNNNLYFKKREDNKYESISFLLIDTFSSNLDIKNNQISSNIIDKNGENEEISSFIYIKSLDSSSFMNFTNNNFTGNEFIKLNNTQIDRNANYFGLSCFERSAKTIFLYVELLNENINLENNFIDNQLNKKNQLELLIRLSNRMLNSSEILNNNIKNNIMNQNNINSSLILVKWKRYSLSLPATQSFINLNELNEIISENRVLANNVYYLKRNLFILENSSLTINPGVKIVFSFNTGIYVYGSLILNGSLDKNILFEYTNQTECEGKATQISRIRNLINFLSTKKDSLIQNVKFFISYPFRLRYDLRGSSLILVQGLSPLIRNTSIEGATNAILVAKSSNPIRIDSVKFKGVDYDTIFIATMKQDISIKNISIDGFLGPNNAIRIQTNKLNENEDKYSLDEFINCYESSYIDPREDEVIISKIESLNTRNTYCKNLFYTNQDSIFMFRIKTSQSNFNEPLYKFQILDQNDRVINPILNENNLYTYQILMFTEDNYLRLKIDCNSLYPLKSCAREFDSNRLYEIRIKPVPKYYKLNDFKTKSSTFLFPDLFQNQNSTNLWILKPDGLFFSYNKIQSLNSTKFINYFESTEIKYEQNLKPCELRFGIDGYSKPELILNKNFSLNFQLNFDQNVSSLFFTYTSLKFDLKRVLLPVNLIQNLNRFKIKIYVNGFESYENLEFSFYNFSLIPCDCLNKSKINIDISDSKISRININHIQYGREILNKFDFNLNNNLFEPKSYGGYKIPIEVSVDQHNLEKFSISNSILRNYLFNTKLIKYQNSFNLFKENKHFAYMEKMEQNGIFEFKNNFILNNKLGTENSIYINQRINDNYDFKLKSQGSKNFILISDNSFVNNSFTYSNFLDIFYNDNIEFKRNYFYSNTAEKDFLTSKVDSPLVKLNNINPFELYDQVSLNRSTRIYNNLFYSNKNIRSIYLNLLQLSNYSLTEFRNNSFLNQQSIEVVIFRLENFDSFWETLNFNNWNSNEIKNKIDLISDPDKKSGLDKVNYLNRIPFGSWSEACGFGWAQFENKCFSSTSLRLDFNSSVEMCQISFNSSLAFKSKSLENYLKKNFADSNQMFWYQNSNLDYCESININGNISKIDCELKLNFVCEKQPDFFETSSLSTEYQTEISSQTSKKPLKTDFFETSSLSTEYQTEISSQTSKKPLETQKKSSNLANILIPTIGGIFLIATIAFMTIFLIKRKRNKNKKKEEFSIVTIKEARF